MKASETATVKSKPIRILHVHNSADQGGVESIILNLVKGLDEKRFCHDIVFLAPRGQLSAQLEESADRVVYLKTSDGRFARDAIMKALAVTRDADVVNLFAPQKKMGPISWALGKPTVWEVHGTVHDPEIVRQRPIKQMLRRHLVRAMADKILCCTDKAAQDQIELFGQKPENIHVITNGVDTDRFKPDPEAGREVRKKWGIPEDAPLVVVPARFDDGKGINVAIEAMAKVQANPAHANAHVIFCGRHMHQQNAELQKMIRDAGLKNAHCIDYHKDMPPIFAASDVVLLPSKSEALPLVLLEGMATGCLPVATPVGDVPKLLKPVSGELVAVGDPAATARGVENMLALSPELRAQRAAEMRAHVIENYSFERMIHGYEELFADMAQRRLSRQPGRGRQ